MKSIAIRDKMRIWLPQGDRGSLSVFYRGENMRESQASKIVFRLGGDILKSRGMALEKGFRQHGTVSVYEHSLRVAVMCVMIAALLPFRTDLTSLVRGALLHDYFLYDWHSRDRSHRFHGFIHAKRAFQNANRDFTLNRVEKNMILSHMFPMNTVIPKYRESVILCTADKLCAIRETISGSHNG